MNWHMWMPVVVLATSLIAGALIFLVPEHRHHWRSGLNLAAAVIKLGLVLWMATGIVAGEVYETRFAVLPGFDFVLKVDALAILFAVLSSILWLCTTLYAIGYLEGSPNRSRFFGFFSICVASTMGIALAGNLFTFLLFYELLTLSTYPLVVHRGSAASMRAGAIYLRYTLAGGAILMVAILWLTALVGDVAFDRGIALSQLDAMEAPKLIAIFALMVIGLGVKAAIVPMHGWLPIAMVAPAPVSALLHAVAVVKAGAFGIVRVVYDVYGIEFCFQLGVLYPLAIVASFTIIYGSVRALYQTDLKRRLAYSTVSQVSYIVLGACLFGPLGTIGGLVHLLHQGLMKVTLFFCAGNFAETLGVHRVDQLKGLGRRMPITSAAFTLAALGMIGVPPMAGFISKWYLGLGALGAGMEWVLAVLVASSLLNAAYFLPLLYQIWFTDQTEPWPRERIFKGAEAHILLLVPTVITATLALSAGLLAGVSYSPLDWVQLIVEREYQSW